MTKWDSVEEEFVEYLKKHNIVAKVTALAANPTLDGVIALKRELVEAAADETGTAADTNLINYIIGPLYDAEDLLKRGEQEYLPEVLKELVENTESVITKTPILSERDKQWLRDYKIGNK